MAGTRGVVVLRETRKVPTGPISMDGPSCHQKLLAIFLVTQPGVISKSFNDRGSRSNFMKWMWPIYSYVHVFTDVDII